MPLQKHSINIIACKQDGFHPARRRLQELLDKFGLPVRTLSINCTKLYSADFLSESAKLSLTELMAEVDYRLVEGGGEQIQLDALTAKIVSFVE